MTCHVLQLTSQPDLAANLAQIHDYLAALLERDDFTQPELVILPECALQFAVEGAADLAIEPLGQGPMQSALAAIAQRYNVYLVAGTIAIEAPSAKHYASCLMFAPTGELLAHYNKIHLFDVDLPDGTGQYRESDQTQAGEHLCVVTTPLGNVGLAVCYDLRFGQVFQRLVDAGADIIAIPSAFTAVTGAVHWQPLLQARAIENQCFIAAANQCGEHVNGRTTWGNSMLINPWGEILANQGSMPGRITCQLDLNARQVAAQQIPQARHRRDLSNMTIQTIRSHDEL